jgi:uncharacterized SAM-binding protein YcdF (DUF218 family)
MLAKYSSRVRNSQGWQRKQILKLILLLGLLLAFVFAAVNVLPDLILPVPPQTWRLTKSDAIIVLGTPANKLGQPTPVMRERVDEAVKLWKDGDAKYIIFSGTAAHNKFVEAEVMAELARSRGVSASAIVLEPQAQNTYQNAFNSVEIMKQRGWKSAIVVSSIAHLRRANYIFSHYPIKYCMDGCPNPPEQSAWFVFRFDQREKLHLLSAIFSGQSSSFGLTPQQAAQMKQLPAVQSQTSGAAP